MTTFRADILAGRVALVTGGGTGICKGIARAFAAHGASVCLVSRKPDVLAASADEIARETGAAVIAAAADVRQPDQVGGAVTACLERFGRLDVLVNGAAGNFLAPAASLSSNGFRSVVEIDLIGTFHAAKAAFEALQKSDRALILNISATLHYHGTPLQAHAAAAKAGVDSLTRTLAVEWGRLGIRVNAIAPGPIGDTEGMRRLVPPERSPPGSDTGSRGMTPWASPGEIGKRLTDQIPLGRFGTIDDVAGCALYLASAAGAWITGAVFVVDGGHSVAAPSVLMAPAS